MAAMLRISQLAERSGYRPSALRYYEQVGLLAAERTPTGYRLYDESAVSRLQFIDRAKQLGLPLEEIRDLVAVWDGGLCAHVQDRLDAHIAAKAHEVQTRIRELTGLAAQLDAARAELAGPAPPGPCGPGCGCADGPDRAQLRAVPQLVPLMRRRPVPDSDDHGIGAGFAVPAQAQVACTLGATDQQERLSAWRELLAGAIRRERLDGGVRLIFPPDPALAGRLGELAVKEQACCPFLAFALRPAADGVVLEVTATGDAVEVVTGLFGGVS